MTELIYKVGNEFFTNYASALIARDMSGENLTRVYRKVDEQTPAQKEALAAHRAKFWAKRAEQKGATK